MVRRLLLIGCVVVLGALVLSNTSVAQSGLAGGPTPTIVDDPANNVSDDNTKINSWVCRKGNKATVLTVKGDGTGILALYEYRPGVTQNYKVIQSTFRAQVSNPNISVDFHKVKFVLVSDANSPTLQFAIFLESDTQTEITDSAKAVGWFTFISSSGRDRKLSRIVLRLNPDRVVSTVLKTAKEKDEKESDLSGDPCKGPPADDVGEEELLAATQTAGQPDGQFPKTPPAKDPDE